MHDREGVEEDEEEEAGEEEGEGRGKGERERERERTKVNARVNARERQDAPLLCAAFTPPRLLETTAILHHAPTNLTMLPGLYSKAGGAPNGGGNIDNKNSVTILEGLKLALPDSDITYMVGTGINGKGKTCGQGPCTLRALQHEGREERTEAQAHKSYYTPDESPPFWTVIQRHSLSLGAEFSPTAPSSPYKPDSATPKSLPAGAEGLKASYFKGRTVATAPTAPAIFTRRDYAPNFHFFALGPDPFRFRNGSFSVRWEGVLTPDATVEGGLFNIGLGKSRFGTTAPAGLGGRLYADGKLVVDAWRSGASTVSSPFNFVKGKPIKIKLEYFQDSTDGNPSVALLWSLLPSSSAHNPIIAAAAAVPEYDAVVVVVGGANNDQTGTTEGEGVDRASLTLAGQQLALIQAVYNASASAAVPMVVVLVDGRPTAEPYLLTLPAVIAAFQGGQAQGVGVAEVLTGRYNPSGKLPVSFPASSNVLPCFYNHKPSASRGGWIDADLPDGNGVLWSFGHGLSYTSFNYSNVVLPKAAVVAAKGAVAKIAVTVTNVGPVAGEEVAQLYLRDLVAPVTTPVKMLKGFERVSLASGASKVVTFEVDVAVELKLLNRKFEWELPQGSFKVMVGGSSATAADAGTFEIA